MYHIFGPSIYEEYGVLEEPELPLRVSFQSGTLISTAIDEPLAIIVEHTAKTPPGDFLEMTIPIMSDRLVEALGRSGIDNLQTFPAAVQSASSPDSWQSYRAVNVVGAIAAADLTRSTYADPSGRGVLLVDFEVLVLDEKKASNTLMFRLAESPGILLVHDKVKESLLSVTPALRGLFFEEIESS